MDLKKYITDVKDFPTKGITFKDVTSLCENAEAFSKAIEELSKYAKSRGAEVIVAPESRGFIFGCPVASNLNIGFVPVRKPGKLPRETISESYSLEYGTNVLAIHKDSIKKGQKCVIIDDLLATGGTINASAKLIEDLGGEVVGICCLIELIDLNGKESLSKYDFYSLIKDTE